MLKKVLTVCFLVMLTFPIAGKAFAVNQLPNAEVVLSHYTNWYGTGVTRYCTATKSHINLRIDNYAGGGSITSWLEYRGTNQAWKTFNTKGKTTLSGRSYTYNLNATKGYDYRLKIKSGYINKPSGIVSCW